MPNDDDLWEITDPRTQRTIRMRSATEPTDEQVLAEFVRSANEARTLGGVVKGTAIDLAPAIGGTIGGIGGFAAGGPGGMAIGAGLGAGAGSMAQDLLRDEEIRPGKAMWEAGGNVVGGVVMNKLGKVMPGAANNAYRSLVGPNKNTGWVPSAEDAEYILSRGRGPFTPRNTDALLREVESSPLQVKATRQVLSPSGIIDPNTGKTAIRNVITETEPNPAWTAVQAHKQGVANASKAAARPSSTMAGAGATALGGAITGGPGGAAAGAAVGAAAKPLLGPLMRSHVLQAIHAAGPEMPTIFKALLLSRLGIQGGLDVYDRTTNPPPYPEGMDPAAKK